MTWEGSTENLEKVTRYVTFRLKVLVRLGDTVRNFAQVSGSYAKWAVPDCIISAE